MHHLSDSFEFHFFVVSFYVFGAQDILSMRNVGSVLAVEDCHAIVKR